MDLEMVGYVMQPEEIGCKKEVRITEEKPCTNHTIEKPLTPTTLLVGCHKTRYATKKGQKYLCENGNFYDKIR